MKNTTSNNIVKSLGSTTARSLEDRFADAVNVKDFGAVGDGITDDTQSFIEAINSGTYALEVPRGTYFIGSNFSIPNTCTLDIKGKLLLDDNVNVTINININGDIEAGHYQIFETGTDSYVLPTYWDNTPQVDRPVTTHVKVAWFGVKNDGKHPATRHTPQDGTNVIGDQPTGTDSTEAMKAACKFAQYASFHAVWNDELHTLCPIHLQPNSKIILKGNNSMGFQMWLDAISNMRVLPDFRTDPDYTNLTRSTIDYKIIGNIATILFVPESSTDAIFGETININQIYVEYLTVLPLGFTGVGWGRLLKNSALVYEGSSGRDAFFNALTQQHFDRVWFSIPSGNVDSFGVDGETNPSDYIFTYEGYSLGDRLRINGCNFRNMERVLHVDNPEAVEFKIENTSCALYADDTRFYNFSAHYSQFHIENTLHLMKGNNQRLLNFIANYSDDYQKFSSSSRIQLTNCRIEGSEGNDKTLINANFGQFYIENIDSQTSTSGESSGSFSANLQRLATAEFKNCNVANRFALTLADFNGTTPDVDQYSGLIRSPMLTFEDCNFTGDGGRGALIHRSTFNGTTYGQAVINLQNNSALRVLTVKIIDSPNTSRGGSYGYYVPLCTYYGTNLVPEGYDKVQLYTPTSSANGYQYATKNTTGWQFPPWARINKFMISIGPTTNTFTHIVLSIGDETSTEFKRIFSLSEASGDPSWYTKSWNELDLLTDTVSSTTEISAAGPDPVIGTPTGDPAKLYTRIYFTDSGGVELTGNHPPTKFSIEYRCMREPSEVINIGESGSNIR